jgi:hypothetical protein
MIYSQSGERQGSEPLASERFAVERKVFFLDLKENDRGRFMKITEDVGGHRDTILLPAEVFGAFAQAFAKLMEFDQHSRVQ